MNNLKIVNGHSSKIKSAIWDATTKYKNDFSVFNNPLIAKIHTTGFVAFEDINTFGDHQTRVDDLDHKHVEDL